MEISKIINSKTLQIALLLITFGVVFRLLPHEANFAPVAAIALLGGAMLGRKYALFVPLAILLISDMVLGFYSSLVFTWLAFILIATYGMLFRKSSFTKRVILGGVGSASIFFIVSNFGVWAISGMYPLTLAGLAESYFMAVPFFRATLVSDLVYSGVLFGAAAWLAQTRGLFYQKATC